MYVFQASNVAPHQAAEHTATNSAVKVVATKPAILAKQGVIVQALSTNTASVFVGGAGVDNTTGYELAAGKDVAFLIEDPSLIYSYCGTASQKLHIIWM